MGSLSNLYISQSYQSLAHLGTNNALVSGTMTVLQDGLGNSLNISFDGTNISSSGNIFAANLTGSGVLPAGVISSSAQISTLGFVSSSVTASSLITASFDNGTRNLTFTKGDASTFNVNIPDVSGSTGNFATTGSNVFIGNQTISGSLFISGSEVVAGPVTASKLQINGITDLNGTLDVSNDATFRGDVLIQSATPNLKLRDTSGGGFSSGYDLRVDTGSFQIYDDTHNRDVLSDFFNSASQQHTTSLTSEIIVISGSTSVTLIGNVSASIISASTINGLGDPLAFSQSVDSRLDNLESTSASLLIETQNLELFSASALTSLSNLNTATASLFTSASLALTTASVTGTTMTFSKGDGTTFNVTLPTGSGGGSIDTGSFATTGSNVFTGDQTLIDNANNYFTITDASGSMLLVAKGFTSSSLHLSSSISAVGSGSVNLIFKANNNTADTIISGSHNIFVNPNAATAGFKRYIGGNNNIYNSILAPQISGSMQFSPTMNGNIGPFALIMRGPVSSSTWTISTNIAAGNISIGSSATNHAQGLISGLSIQQNNIGGTLNVIANQSNHTSSTSINSNNINGFVALQLSSSAANFSNNTINDSTFILTNQYYSSSLGAGGVTVIRNTIGGASNTILTTGILDAGASQPNIINSTIGGSANNIHSNASGAGSRNSINAIIVFGNTLIVSASSNATTTNENGSAFFGRHNAQDGVRNKTSQTVFAVGTGTSAFKKTGFLIDSGSNTFIEGTLNVSGSTTMTGSLSVIGNSTFNGSQSITGSLTASGSISLNGLTLTKGVNNNNTALGTNVLQNAVSGGNVAIGNSALQLNTSGTDNIALGDNALNQNISGDRNMAIGSNTLDSNTTGTLNVAIGNATLAGLIDGSANVGIGFEALKNQITGSDNTGIGKQALNQNISGSSNIAIGASAGYNETGSANFYVGIGNRGSIDADRSGSLMWGKMDAFTATNQTLQINAQTNITNGLSVQGDVKFNKGSNKTCDIVTVNASATISNSLVTANSIILVTCQDRQNQADEYPPVVGNKTTGAFDIFTNVATNMEVAYLIINPTA